MPQTDANPDHVLRVVQDEAGRKMAEKLLNHYVRDPAKATAYLPAFLIAIDRNLGDHGGEPVKEEPEDRDDESTDEDYADDADLHSLPEEAADVDAMRVKSAIKKALGE